MRCIKSKTSKKKQCHEDCDNNTIPFGPLTKRNEINSTWIEHMDSGNSIQCKHVSIRNYGDIQRTALHCLNAHCMPLCTHNAHHCAGTHTARQCVSTHTARHCRHSMHATVHALKKLHATARTATLHATVHVCIPNAQSRLFSRK